MVWQDILISVVNVVLSSSIAYQVYLGFRNKKGYLSLFTSSLSFLGLYVISATFFSLALYYSAIITAISATLWLTLFVQKIIYVEN